MCGRFNISNLSLKLLREKAKALNASIRNFNELDYPHFNHDVFPSQPTPIIFKYKSENILTSAVWGMKNIKKNLIINARTETVNENFYFRNIAFNRAIIACNWFYEWSEDKIKYWFNSERPLFLGCLYTLNSPSDIPQFVICTQPAIVPVSNIHHRMPLIIPEKQIENFLADKNIKQFIIDCNKDIQLSAKTDQDNMFSLIKE